MHRHSVLFGLGLVLVAGCSSLDDTPTVLTGSWGGPDMLVTGSLAGAGIQLTCVMASFVGPLRLDDPAGFVATGTMFNGAINHFEVPARVIVTASHDTAMLKFQTMYNGEWGGNDVFRVVQGQPITYPDGRICAD